MAQALVEYETLDAELIDAIMAGHAIDSAVSTPAVLLGKSGMSDGSSPDRGSDKPLIGDQWRNI